MSDPNNPLGFGLPIPAWDADRLHVKQLLSMNPLSELMSNGKLTISGNNLVFKSGPLCITHNLQVDTIIGKKMPNNIQLAGIPIVDGKIPTSAFENPPLVIKGCWNAQTNVPHLTSGVGENGDYYLVCVNGNTNLDGNYSWAVGEAAVFNSMTNTWYRLGVVDAQIESAGGTSLVKYDQGPSMVVKGLTAGTAIGLTSTANNITINNSDPATLVSLNSIGGTSLVNTSSGPSIATKGLTNGSNISLTATTGAITISNLQPSLTLASAGGQTLVASSGVGPNLGIKGLTAGNGMSLVGSATDITVVNTSPASSASLASTGVGQTLVNTGTPSSFLMKGLTAGIGISLLPTSNDITIINTNSAGGITLTNAGAGTSLVNTGVGPALATKGLVAGSGISFGVSSTDVTINSTNATTTLSSVGGSNTLVNTGTGPNLKTKGLTADASINMVATATNITLNDPGTSVALTSAGGTNSLVTSGSGPTLAIKGLTSGTNMSLTSTSTNVTLINSDPATGVALSNAGVGTSIVASSGGSGTNLALCGLAASTGISMSTTATNVTITSSIIQGPIVYFCGEATPNLSFSPFGFYNPNNTTIQQTTIAAGSNGAVLPQATINVVNTTGFPVSGTLQISTSTGVNYVSYTGTTGTSFTGCTGGTGTLSTGGFVTQTSITSGGISPGGQSQISIYGTWYDPYSAWTPGSGVLSINSSTKYISSWNVPIGSYSNSMPPTNTNSFVAWSRCGDGVNWPSLLVFGNSVSFGGGGTGTSGTIMTSGGTTAINVPTSGSVNTTTTFQNLSLYIYNDTGSATNVDVDLHLFPDNNFRINGSSWIVYQF